MLYTPMPGKPHLAATEAETLTMIRGVLTEEIDADPKPKPKTTPRMRRKQAFAPLSESEGRAKQRKLPRMSLPRPSLKLNSRGRGAGLRGRIKRKHVTLGILAGLTLWQPLVMLGVALALLALVLLAFKLIGGERIWKGVLLSLREIGQKNPAKGRDLRTRLDQMAMRWDTILDRFPDGTVDGLYMPDFQVLETEDMDYTQKVNERLARLREQA